MDYSQNQPLDRAKKHVYGRRKGRPLRVRKTQLMEEFYPLVKIVLPDGKPLSLQELFKDTTAAPLWLEIGFGGGEHLAAQAALHPDIRFIGCEPFVNGVASLLDHLEREDIGNVRIYGDDARRVLDVLPDHSLERCFILFADPWPKSRHAERRFVGPENLQRLARVLKPGGLLRISSDHSQLIEWVREQIDIANTGQQIFVSIYDSAKPPLDWIQTRYQEKAIAAGRVTVFLDYRRS